MSALSCISTKNKKKVLMGWRHRKTEAWQLQHVQKVSTGMVSWLGEMKAAPQDSQHKPGWSQAYEKQTKPRTVHLVQENPQQGLKMEMWCSVFPRKPRASWAVRGKCSYWRRGRDTSQCSSQVTSLLAKAASLWGALLG